MPHALFPGPVLQHILAFISNNSAAMWQNSISVQSLSFFYT